MDILILLAIPLWVSYLFIREAWQIVKGQGPSGLVVNDYIDQRDDDRVANLIMTDAAPSPRVDRSREPADDYSFEPDDDLPY